MAATAARTTAVAAGPGALEAARGEDERERHRDENNLWHEEGHVLHRPPASSMGDEVMAESRCATGARMKPRTDSG